MIIDKELVFSDNGTIMNQDISQTVGDYDSSKVIDQVKDGGPYMGSWLFVKISEAVVGSGASVEFALHTSNDGFGSDDDVIFTTGAVGVASLTANTVIVRSPLPLGLKRDIKMVFSVSGATTTAGTVFAAIVPDVNEGF